MPKKAKKIKKTSNRSKKAAVFLRSVRPALKKPLKKVRKSVTRFKNKVAPDAYLEIKKEPVLAPEDSVRSVGKMPVLEAEAQPEIKAEPLKNKGLVLEVLNEEAPVKVSVGAHALSPYALDLDEALPEFQVNAGKEEELKSFFEAPAPAPRRSRIRRSNALLRGIFSDERDYRLMSPARPRLLEELADELIIINLAQLVFNVARWIFAGYFGILSFFAGGVLRLVSRKEKPHPVAHLGEKARVARMKELIKINPYQAFRAEPVAWKANLGLLHFAPPVRFERALATFVLLAFVFVLPLRIVSTYRELQNTKSVFMERSVQAFEALNNSWSQVGNLEGAVDAFENASKSFDSILSDVEETHKVLQNIAAVLPEGEQLDAGKALLLAGSQVSAAAEVMTARLATLDDSMITPAERVHQLGESLQTALPLLNNARENLDSISIEIIPQEFRSKATTAVGLLDHVIEGVESSETATAVLEDILGRVSPRRFLLVFQNNTEIRPTGGFMGSFAEVNTDDGAVTGLWMPGAGSYELQGSLRATLVPPAPLQLITDHWQFHDSNWFPDFPTSAKKIMWFYEKAGGPTVDGVIALTTSVVEKILEATGPIDMPEYGKVITADNFWIETQKAVELEYDKEENKPKQFLSDLAPKLLEKLQSKDPKLFFKLANALHEAIQEKHFQIYLKDQALQDKVMHLGWAGSLKQTAGDMLAVVNTNVAGGKTDAVVGEHIKHEANISPDGKVTVTVEVTRTHHGVKGELFRGVRNVDYVRVYAPLGSRLISAGGFRKPDETLFKTVAAAAVPDADLAAVDATAIDDMASGTKIYTESGHTVFGNWTMVDPGGSITYKLVYELPFLVTLKEAPKTFLEKIGLEKSPLPQAAYSFLLIKQAGTNDTTFEHTVKIPEAWEGIWKYPGTVSVPGKLDRDLFFGTVMVPR